ncbi:NUDIX domain-containing protein [Catenulispora subtropica]|uniref:NUDIX domain-containing protein n=1 Tax=Catenulispora subtropica TaxID=450798 RepID=UPI0031D4ADE1
MTEPEQPRFTWSESPVPDGIPVTQVYLWALDPDDGRVLIQDRGLSLVRPHSLPGGRPEPEDGGDPLRTAAREAMEESQIRIDAERAVYLGYQLVEGDPKRPGPYAQTRYAVPISGYGPIGPDPDNGRVNRRFMTSLDRAPELLAWGEHGRAQAAAAKRAGAALGIPVDDPAPDGYRDGEKARYLVCNDYGMGALWWWVQARGAREIMERVADVVVIHRVETVRQAEDWDLEEVDIDASDPNPLSDPKAKRDEQRRRPGFGACVGRGTVYFRRPWGESGHTPWIGEDGETHYLYEIGEDGYRTRQVVEFAEGPAQKTSEDDWLFNPPFDLYEPEWAEYEIDRSEFETAWDAAVPAPDYED